MSYEAKFAGWKSLSIEDLLVAYRKAKADCFFENTFPTAVKFAEYEQNLLDSLKALLDRLKANKGFASEKKWLGDFRVLPKKLSVKPKQDVINGHIHFSSPERAFKSLVTNNDLIPEFRIVGDFPVEAHIISALWINTVGHKFDACLDDSCYGARLKRVRNDETLDINAQKPFHITAIGSFTPYFQPYQKWRNDGLTAIRGELEKERDVVAVSLDFKSYYHFIDPMALASKALHEQLGLALTKEELAFTKELAKFLDAWSAGAKEFSKQIIQGKADISGGLVIGLTASRIVSNVLLQRWDTLIKQKIAPVHYGRYVDDMFVVLHDTGCINNTDKFMGFLQERLGEDCIFREKGTQAKDGNKLPDNLWQIQLGKKLQGESRIRLQSDKQKLFVLQGRAGLDLLDSIEKEIHQLSSEHRLMPSPDHLEDSTAARVLSAAGSVSEQADTLRRADGLTIRRLSLSLQLRHVEILAHDLPSKEWIKQREDFYQFAHNHILRPDNLFAQFIYLPRLLGFAISLNEWTQAEKIVLSAFSSLDQLANQIKVGGDIALNGTTVSSGPNLWRLVKGTLTWIFVDAAARYYDPNKLLSGAPTKKERRIAQLFLNGIWGELINVNDILRFEFGSEDFYEKAPLIAMADLAKVPYKKILTSDSADALLSKRDSKKERKILKALSSSELVDVDVLESFWEVTRTTRLAAIEQGKRSGESRLPYIFPTRPLTPTEIAELAPECVGLPRADGKPSEDKPSVIWAKYTQALRGVWIKASLLAAEQDKDESQVSDGKRVEKKLLKIGTDRKNKIVVALTNLKTDYNDWSAMACDRSNLTLDRYSRIAELVNQAIKLKPKPDY